MWQPAKPALSNSRIVRATFSAPPKPVSASTIAGIATAFATYPASLTTSVNVSRPMSGTPAVAFAIPAPLTYTASNPARSTCRAIAALGTPGIITAAFAINSRNRAALLFVVMSSDLLSFRAKSRNLLLFPSVLWHFRRLHQLIRVFRLIELPHNINDLPCAIAAEHRVNQNIKLLFHLRILERILRVPHRIIDTPGQSPAVGEINMHDVCHRAGVQPAQFRVAFDLHVR